ncbi:MAG: TolC family protein [Candidatus Hydrogenedentales bacterium]
MSTIGLAHAQLDTVITLGQAAALALTHNPRLQVFPFDVRAAEARILQASLWPNPALVFEVEDVRLSDGPTERLRTASIGGDGISFERSEMDGGPAGFREAEFTLRVSQLFLLGGKRDKAVAVSLRERDAAAWDYEIARANVMRDVASAYVNVLAAQARVAEQTNLQALAREVEQTITARADAGKVSPIEGKRTSVQTASATIALERAERALGQARVALASTWGEALPQFTRAGGTLDQTAELPVLAALLERTTNNPDLKRWQYELAQREAELSLARAHRLPDLTASLGLVTQGVDERRSRGLSFGTSGSSISRSKLSFGEGRENRIELELSIPLPIFNRNQGNIREAEIFVERTGAEQRVTVSQIRAAIADWYEQAHAAFEEITRLTETALPVAEDVFESIQIGYEAGKFGYLEVLDAQRTLFELRMQLLDAYTAYHLAVVEIERLLGAPVWADATLFGASTQENFHVVE